MFEDNSKTARHRFEWWEDIGRFLYYVDDHLGRGICSRHPTRLIPVRSALVVGVIQGPQMSALSGVGSGVISDEVACIAW